MNNYVFVGHPLESFILEPIMNSVFAQAKIDANFKCQDLDENDFKNLKSKLLTSEISGIFPVDPYKTPAVKFVENKGHDLITINAVNFLFLDEYGHIQGVNLNYLAFNECLKNVNFDAKNKNVLILGAGGAGRAAAYALHELGANVFLWNRTKEKAENFINSAEKNNVNLNLVENLNELNVQLSLIINATSMSDLDTQKTLVPYNLWENVELAMDAVYGKTSLFLEEAFASNVKNIISGEKWLLNQAVHLFKIISKNQKIVPIEFMENAVKNAIKN